MLRKTLGARIFEVENDERKNSDIQIRTIPTDLIPADSKKPNHKINMIRITFDCYKD